MNDNPIITICIPVYNGESFLKRCLDSVMNALQQESGIEIVLVDDGSTDNTLQVMREWKQLGQSIHSIHQSHLGLAQARWTGVRNANGRYISFLDVDDYLLENACSEILRCIKGSDADIIEYLTIRDGGCKSSNYKAKGNTRLSEEVLQDYFNGLPIPVNLWLRVYKRELFTEQMFPIDVTLHEDVFILPCLFYRAKTITYIDKPLIVHTSDNPKSIMNEFKGLKNTRDYFEKQKTLLHSIPHIASNIGYSCSIKVGIVDEVYDTSFVHYIARICLNFLFMNVKGVSYREKIEAIADNLNLSRKEVEKCIERYVPVASRSSRAVGLIGLKLAYVLHKAWHTLLDRKR